MDGQPFLRFASAAEIPAFRRQNGGGTTRFIMHLVPRTVPEPVILAGRYPAVFHTEDQALVTGEDPAAPGEVLTMLVKNLGPTNPGVDPGQPFPRDPLNVVNSPVAVWVNGEPATVLYAGGEPGAVDVFELEFRLPGTTQPGRAHVQILTGFLQGPEFGLPVSD